MSGDWKNRYHKIYVIIYQKFKKANITTTLEVFLLLEAGMKDHMINWVSPCLLWGVLWPLHKEYGEYLQLLHVTSFLMDSMASRGRGPRTSCLDWHRRCPPPFTQKALMRCALNAEWVGNVYNGLPLNPHDHTTSKNVYDDPPAEKLWTFILRFSEEDPTSSSNSKRLRMRLSYNVGIIVTPTQGSVDLTWTPFLKCSPWWLGVASEILYKTLWDLTIQYIQDVL